MEMRCKIVWFFFLRHFLDQMIDLCNLLTTIIRIHSCLKPNKSERRKKQSRNSSSLKPKIYRKFQIQSKQHTQRVDSYRLKIDCEMRLKWKRPVLPLVANHLKYVFFFFKCRTRSFFEYSNGLSLKRTSCHNRKTYSTGTYSDKPTDRPNDR